MKCTPIVPLLLLAAASAAPIANGPSELLLALNKGDHTLAIVDATTLQVLGKAASGPDPHEVVGSADGTLAYISNYTAGNGFENSLSVIDLTARKALPPIDLGSLSRPHGLALRAERSTSPRKPPARSAGTILRATRWTGP